MTWEQEIIDYSLSCMPEEACGLLAKVNQTIRFFKCVNYAEDKINNFMIGVDDWMRIEDQAHIVGIVHSHPNSKAELSEPDKKNCIGLDYPYYVVSCLDKNYKVFYPKDLK